MKLCIVCKTRPAAVPDRRFQGRYIKKVCRECHTLRLREDLMAIIKTVKNGLADEPGSREVIAAFDSLTGIQNSFADEKKSIEVTESNGGEIVVSIRDRGI